MTENSVKGSVMDMDVRNCKKCGKLFNHAIGPVICPLCKDQLEEKFQEVKKYIRDHPGCGIAEVSDECEVSQQQIKQWLRDERLQFSEDSPVGLNCENCNAMIRSGRFCDKCKLEMTHSLQNMYKSEHKPVEHEKPKDYKDNARMRYLDR